MQDLVKDGRRAPVSQRCLPRWWSCLKSTPGLFDSFSAAWLYFMNLVLLSLCVSWFWILHMLDWSVSAKSTPSVSSSKPAEMKKAITISFSSLKPKPKIFVGAAFFSTGKKPMSMYKKCTPKSVARSASVAAKNKAANIKKLKQQQVIQDSSRQEPKVNHFVYEHHFVSKSQSWNIKLNIYLCFPVCCTERWGEGAEPESEVKVRPYRLDGLCWWRTWNCSTTEVIHDCVFMNNLCCPLVNRLF